MKEIIRLIKFKLLFLPRLFRILKQKPIYNVIGDSHSLTFSNTAFIVHHIGPATAYKLNFQNSTTQSRRKVFSLLKKIYKGKRLNVMFVFGEMDARIHINKISKEKKYTVKHSNKEYRQFIYIFLKICKRKFSINKYICIQFNATRRREKYLRFPILC